MRSGQYKNAIQYALTDEANHGKDNLELTRSILGNMGVSLPKGDYRNVLCKLIGGNYGGWKQCLKDQARAHANYGYAAIGLTKEDVVVIEPDTSMGTKGVYESTNPVVRTVDDISQEEVLDMQFFVYEPVQQRIVAMGSECAWWCTQHNRCGQTPGCAAAKNPQPPGNQFPGVYPNPYTYPPNNSCAACWGSQIGSCAFC